LGGGGGKGEHWKLSKQTREKALDKKKLSKQTSVFEKTGRKKTLLGKK
jgi:hypothetical protein